MPRKQIMPESRKTVRVLHVGAWPRGTPYFADDYTQYYYFLNYVICNC